MGRVACAGDNPMNPAEGIKQKEQKVIKTLKPPKGLKKAGRDYWNKSLSDLYSKQPMCYLLERHM